MKYKEFLETISGVPISMTNVAQDIGINSTKLWGLVGRAKNAGVEFESTTSEEYPGKLFWVTNMDKVYKLTGFDPKKGM